MSQLQAILADLRAGREITPVEALERFGCFRLASRISDLRAKGYRIEARLVRAGAKSFAAYRLAASRGSRS